MSEARLRRGVIGWFASNPIAANLLFILIACAGLSTAFGQRLVMEVFPDIAPDQIAIAVPYPGASPAEVEQAIILPIEEAISDLTGIETITASASEGAGALTVEVSPGFDARKLYDDIATRVNAIPNLPADSERPVIELASRRGEAISLAVYGDVDRRVLQRVAEQVREELLALPEISLVELAGNRGYEIVAELDREALWRHGLSAAEVAEALRANSRDLAGGSLKAERADLLLRVPARARSAAAYAELPVLVHPDGRSVRLGDIATVREALSESDTAVRFQGHPAVLVKVYRTGRQNVFTITEVVKRYQAERAGEMPAGVSLGLWLDNSAWLKQRLELLTRNALQSLLLVLAILALFLGLRLALWVAMGIPVAFLGAIALMPALGVSVNMVSLFAFILVLGIVVDDAIIVSEEIYHRHQLREGGLAAAVRGTRRVMVPVVFSVLTTVAAFVPMAVLPGTFGKAFYMIPAIVIPVLLFSLIESLWVLPGHLALHRDLTTAPWRPWAAVRGGVDRGLQWLLRRAYMPVLHLALRWRWAASALFLAGAILVVAVVARGTLPITFFPRIEADFVTVTVTMPAGSTLPVLEAAVRRIEQAAERLEALHPNTIRHAAVGVGTGLFPGGPGGPTRTPANAATMMLELAPAGERGVRSAELAERWRELIGDIPGAVSLTASAQLGRASKDIELELAHPDLERLRAAADRLRGELASFPGVTDIDDNLRPGKDEIAVQLNERGRALGLSAAALGRQIRRAFFGDEVDRFARGRDEVIVYVRAPRAQRQSLADLLALPISLPQGGQVPLAEVASVQRSVGYAVIRRADGARVVRVSANADPARVSAAVVIETVLTQTAPRLAEEFPGLSLRVAGEDRQRREQTQALFSGFLAALAAIFALIAIPLRSVTQALLIMTTIPMGLVGAALAHLIIGMPLSMMSLIGMVALSGVVVNDGIVLLDAINRMRAHGAGLALACARAGVRRFRPVLLTTLTTCAGLSPIILEPSPQAKFLAPCAVSLGFGVGFATGITLILLPALVLVVADLRRALRWAWSRP
ncbi:MAG: efflux RND transporter permease subunit [Planctomycetes bacterium]|nr:efflux RND transporter permease subunit [Planctomycetota bacterium]